MCCRSFWLSWARALLFASIAPICLYAWAWGLPCSSLRSCRPFRCLRLVLQPMALCFSTRMCLPRAVATLALALHGRFCSCSAKPWASCSFLGSRLPEPSSSAFRLRAHSSRFARRVRNSMRACVPYAMRKTTNFLAFLTKLSMRTIIPMLRLTKIVLRRRSSLPRLASLVAKSAACLPASA